MMEYEFEASFLWRAAFSERSRDRHAGLRRALKAKLLDVRAKVALLVAQIAKDVPSLTVHDVSHLDALWETASLVSGARFKLNPAEAYVLGTSILLHDAGMCLVAYPNGLADLRRTTEWRDTVVSLLQRAGYQEITEDLVSTPPDPVFRTAVSEVLRLLHAKRARELPFMEWQNPEGHSESLIEDLNLRTFYGPVVGNIAYSHHLSVGQLEALLGNRLGAPSSIPSEWTVDPITIACLLRCADAAHIDERRAPRFLRALIRPTGFSAAHWTFQSKLAKPRLEADALVYSSGPEFDLDDAEAWWVCFDTVQMINGELGDTDVLLEDTRRVRFAARRVRGAESPVALAAFVRTKGWVPVDTQLKVSDVPRLVRLFGGTHLYGNDLRTPIRELIQNSSDAIRARRLLQAMDETFGTVILKIKEETDGYWLEVEDNGIGMSERTMVGSLLDFGKSFWTSDAIKLEFPGLLAKGMVATGRFGVGFFSVFMLGDFVRVTSCRFDAALATAKTLEFRSGLEARPILREAFPAESLKQGGTRISVRLKESPYSEDGWLIRKQWHQKVDRVSLRVVMGPLCPNLDVNLFIDDGSSGGELVAPNDWITMDGEKFLSRLDADYTAPAEKRELSIYGRHLRLLYGPDGKAFGRACIWGTTGFPYRSPGRVTVGGFTASSLRGIAGVLLGSPQTIARDSAMPLVSAHVLSAWATEQATILSQSSISESDKLNALGFILQCGGDPAQLPIARRGYEYLNTEQLRAILFEEHSLDLYEGEDVEYDEDADDCHPKDFKQYFENDENIIFVPTYTPVILNVGGQDWPRCIIEPGSPSLPRRYLDVVRNVIAKVWGDDSDELEDDKNVGRVMSTRIVRRVLTFMRPE